MIVENITWFESTTPNGQAQDEQAMNLRLRFNINGYAAHKTFDGQLCWKDRNWLVPEFIFRSTEHCFSSFNLLYTCFGPIH